MTRMRAPARWLRMLRCENDGTTRNPKRGMPLTTDTSTIHTDPIVDNALQTRATRSVRFQWRYEWA